MKNFFAKIVTLPSHTHHHKDAKLSMKWLTQQHQENNWNSLGDLKDVFPRPLVSKGEKNKKNNNNNNITFQ